MTSCLVVSGTCVAHDEVLECMRRVGDCAVRMEGGCAVVEFRDARRARAAQNAYHNSMLGSAFVSVRGCGEGGAALGAPRQTPRTRGVTVMLVSGKPLCRITTARAMPPSIDVISTTQLRDTSALDKNQSFAISGFTRFDSENLSDYVKALYRASECAVATAGAEFIYIFPACPELEVPAKAQGGLAVGFFL